MMRRRATLAANSFARFGDNMSRIGRAPIYFDDKTQVSVTPANEVIVKGGKKLSDS